VFFRGGEGEREIILFIFWQFVGQPRVYFGGGGGGGGSTKLLNLKRCFLLRVRTNP